MAQTPNAQRKARGRPAALAIIAVLVILLAAYYFITSQAAASPAIALLETGRPVQFSSVANAINASISSQARLNVTYSGQAAIKLNSKLGSLNFTSPVSLEFLKYYNYSLTNLTIRNVALVGNISTVVLKTPNASYSCSKLSIGLPANSLQQASIGSPCQRITNSGASSSQGFGLFSGLAGNMTIKGIGQREYNGIGCYLAAGSGNVTAAGFGSVASGIESLLPSTGGNLTYNASLCLSNKYSVPLFFKIVYGTSGETLELSLNETGINQDVNQTVFQDLLKN
ncbi:MAG: hypothetical protein LVQ97_04810 [Candidatus Micrarchaeales archaeon]|jgi:hypothetical protein|uniref:Uncharacterized protein n=1 Tax=Candidatus Micrarchaeum acidiphilum ARMAN-2 TaxID=425595 RepID=C7DGX0_MICA2|nr:MAG: hypothetical protein UNLARM2_0320 [Candidatus Micrarchaeum acidiphilum ARMAN-2]MCW6161479.1 hypothetical protein [Candidatus Micrarchaeales archaeon]